jgi:hypothetical protein
MAKRKGKELTPPQVLTLLFEGQELPKQAGTTGYAKIREMRRDPTIALARWLTVAPILESEWSVDANEDAPEGAKEFIAKAILPHQNHLMRTGLYGCIDFGWQSYEKVWGMNRDGMFVVQKFKPLLHDITKILVDVATGSYEGLRQWPFTTSQIDLMGADTLLYSFDVEGTDWYGQAIMRIAEGPYDAWGTVDGAAQRYDKKIAGTKIVVKYPMGYEDESGQLVDNQEKALAVINALGQSAGVAIPKRIQDSMDAAAIEKLAWEIDLLEGSGNTTTTFIDRMKYLDVLKVRAFGLPERAILEGQYGTKAEAGEHADFAISNMQQRHNLLVQHTNSYCVNDMLRMNYGPEAEDSVFIVPSPINDLALGFLREIYKSIIASPENFLLEYGNIDFEGMRKRLDIPTLTEEEREDVDVVRELLRPEADPIETEEEEVAEEPTSVAS